MSVACPHSPDLSEAQPVIAVSGSDNSGGRAGITVKGKVISTKYWTATAPKQRGWKVH